MARPTIEDIRGLGDFMVSNLWEVEITNPAAVGADFAGINFRAVSFEVPKRSGNSLEVNIRGQKIKQPGDYEYSGQVTLTLAETEQDAGIHNLIRVWREAIIETNTNSQLRKSDIESLATITRLDRRGIPLPGEAKWVLVGVYLEDYELGDLNEAGDVIQPTITLSYDYFYDI